MSLSHSTILTAYRSIITRHILPLAMEKTSPDNTPFDALIPQKRADLEATLAPWKEIIRKFESGVFGLQLDARLEDYTTNWTLTKSKKVMRELLEEYKKVDADDAKRAEEVSTVRNWLEGTRKEMRMIVEVMVEFGVE
jgi:hypothetical protein